MRVALGLDHVVQAWARTHGTTSLVGPGGAVFVASLEAVVNQERNEFVWLLDNIDLALTRRRSGYFYARDLRSTGFTNWELLTFAERDDLWPRTAWWRGGATVHNPLENWP